jgi:hypothetical protein
MVKPAKAGDSLYKGYRYLRQDLQPVIDGLKNQD